MLDCKAVSELNNRLLEKEKLSFGQRFGLKLHLMMCKICKQYQKQSEQIQKLLEKKSTRSLSEEEKTQIKAAIQNNTSS